RQVECDVQQRGALGTARGEFAHLVPRASHVRGFTLVELLAVVGMISILAAVSAPGVISVLRDRRVNHSATSVAEMYRAARSRAVGRGAAILVRWDASGGSGTNGLIEMHEAVVDANANPVPSSSCLTTNWDSTDQQRLITRFETSTVPHEYAGVKVY